MVELQYNSARFSKTLKKISQKVEEELESEVLCSTTCFVSIDFKSGWVEIEMDESGGKEVKVMHNGNDRISENIEEAITLCLPEWDDVRQEQEREERNYEDMRLYVQHIY